MKWSCTWILAVAVIIGICVLLDWFGHLGWGYSWWSVTFLIGVSAVAIVVRRMLVVTLKRTSLE